MVLKRFKRGIKSGRTYPASEKDEYIEVDVGGASGSPSLSAHGKIGIRIESLEEFSDSEKILRFLREGSIVMLKIKTLKEKDLSELKRAVDRLKRTVLAQNGDLVGVEQDWLLLVPEHAVVHR
ncbi:MAG: cell division protein SepF [Candidatus Aenigmarchaeota archaeon]|nr:cell division protein SepF [Candidatus Aenigmarchaeota archaeon]